MYANITEYLGPKIPQSNLITEPYIEKFETTPKPKLKYIPNPSDPKIWGPPFWFSLHVSAAHYPVNANPIVKERMKHRILAIPYEIPCGVCRPHAIAFIEKHKEHLDSIVSGRHNLGKFYVDFHNQVNKRYNKPEWTYEDAYKVYSGDTKITFLEN